MTSSPRRCAAAFICPVVLAAVCGPATAQEEAPGVLQLRGIVRDLREREVPDGHPDFEPSMSEYGGRVSGNVAHALGADGKPVFTGAGHKVASQWRDAEGRQICYALYDPARGDTDGSWSEPSTSGITSAESFNQWYRDVLGVNLSKPLLITLVRQADGLYVFDDRYDPTYRDLGGFFPIDDQLFGNSPGSRHNFHFTFELHTEFTYRAADAQQFMFIGDDDVWVYVDGRLVTDLGGVHAAHDQYVELDRMGLVDGETYTLDFFFAERHRTHSNFRIETNLILRTTGDVPPITHAYD